MMKNVLIITLTLLFFKSVFSQDKKSINAKAVRERISINDSWRFFQYDSASQADDLIYDVRPKVRDHKDDKAADARPTEAVKVEAEQIVLKPWIMPSGNAFIIDSKAHHKRPEGNPGKDFSFVKNNFDDQSWEKVTLPHDWAIKGPFYKGPQAKVGGGMGRLPSHGISWYRRKLEIPKSDSGRSIILEVDGAMSYAMVWLNGHLVGGWPYGYASWSLDLTPYIVPGGNNQLAIRVDKPPVSSRWYPGGGIYRNVWLTKTSPTHVAQWGTFVTGKDVTKSSATIVVELLLENQQKQSAELAANTKIFTIDSGNRIIGKEVATIKFAKSTILPGERVRLKGSAAINNPRLWGPFPTQSPHRYVAITTLYKKGKLVDRYETIFGLRSLQFDPEKGLFVNGELVFIKGVNQHHDLGPLGAAFNYRAAERQLELLRELGCNAIRMAHNPPAPELLELTDKMGFLVIDEIFDGWELKKTPLDFHLIFPEWHEQDIRAFIRRDRNHPSVILWSYGNEVGEQYTGEEGARLAKKLRDIVKSEDPTRLTTVSMNYAKPDMPLSEVAEVINLNYQGEGIRDAPEYAGLKGIKTSPLFRAFHAKFPEKLIMSSENAAAVSTRGEYLFPVTKGLSAPVNDSSGGDSQKQYVSAYELYSVDFGASADKVFASEDKHSFVAGGFVWSGWDYLGEPTPYYLSRSSYFGLIDLAGFKKDRFYLYQSRWRPELPMVHILPHWNWPERLGQITPVHVFTSGDEAELFLNGKSLGKKKKQPFEYRLRWDDVRYEPGEVKVIAYRDGKNWAEQTKVTTGRAVGLEATVDRNQIKNDGNDLTFVTVRIVDKGGLTVPIAKNEISFAVEGPGEIVATDNGDPTNLVSFASHKKEAFNGLCLVVVRSVAGIAGVIKLTVKAEGLKTTTVEMLSQTAR